MSGDIARFPAAKRGIRVIIRAAPAGFMVEVDPPSLTPPPGLNLGPHRLRACARLIGGGIGILWRCPVIDEDETGAAP